MISCPSRNWPPFHNDIGATFNGVFDTFRRAVSQAGQQQLAVQSGMRLRMAAEETLFASAGRVSLLGRRAV
jgi:hypothetical protein